MSSSAPIPAVITMLPLFHEKAATIAMIKHGMDVLLSITNCLNPGQIPVTAFDQPLYTLAKYIQWCWPQKYGEHAWGAAHRNGSLEHIRRFS